MREKTCFIGLGSNLGERELYLKQALEALGDLPETRLVEVSSFYETEPVACSGSWFLNAALRIDTLLSPEVLLQNCMAIERRLGRIRNSSPNAPRTLDLDILFYESLVLDSPSLCIPHPRLHERAFVLIPLSEIAGDFHHPILKRSVYEMLSHLKAHPLEGHQPKVQQIKAQQFKARQFKAPKFKAQQRAMVSSLRSTPNP